MINLSSGKIFSAIFIMAVWSTGTFADVHYVDVNCASPEPPYTNWVSAATNIQAAIDEASNCDTVLVASGTYDGGLVITNNISVVSVDGAETTIVDGGGVTRCLFMNNSNAIFSGFTLTHGSADLGGGARIDAGNIEWCIIKNNIAVGYEVISWCGGPYGICYGHFSYGGGIYGGNINYCTIVSNTAGANLAHYGQVAGGGVSDGNVRNSLICGNLAYATNAGECTASGGGVNGGVVESCTIVNNSASGSGGSSGGGCSGANCRNSIVYFNSPSDISGGECNYTCRSSGPSGTGNIAGDPKFVNSSVGNYRLALSSPCVGAGTNESWMIEAFDLDGSPRISDYNVDMGCYEATISNITPPKIILPVSVSNGCSGVYHTTNQSVWIFGDKIFNHWTVCRTDSGVFSTNGLYQSLGDQVWSNEFSLDWSGGKTGTGSLSQGLSNKKYFLV